MNEAEFHSYLTQIRVSAISAECARDAIRQAEERLTAISTASTDGMYVAAGSVDYDRIALRVHALQAIRKRRGRELHRDVEVLKGFRARLCESGLGDDERRVVWAKVVLGMSNRRIAKEFGVDLRHVYPMFRASRAVLAESLGVGEDGPE